MLESAEVQMNLFKMILAVLQIKYNIPKAVNCGKNIVDTILNNNNSVEDHPHHPLLKVMKRGEFASELYVTIFFFKYELSWSPLFVKLCMQVT